MNNIRIPDKIKHIFTDTVWSAAGLVLMNAAAQLLVYPFWNRSLGSEAYGNIVYLLAVMNILAISVGSGVNYARMQRSAAGETANRPYLLLLAAGTLLSLLVLLLLWALGVLSMGGGEFALFCLLTAATMWRCYADVEYRLRVNYRGFFLYYVVIGAGYVFGLWLFRLTGLWPLALLPGELAGLAFVLWRGSVFRPDPDRGRADAQREAFRPVLNVALLLVGSSLLSQLFFNGDRVVLRAFTDGAAVSVYYVATLFGKTMTFISTPLNGVLVGHLAKYEGKLTKRLMDRVTVLTLAAAAVFTVGCVAASHIVLPWLYPAEWEAVRPYLLVASAAQVLYFTGNVLTSSVLLRFTRARNQVTVNAAYGGSFLALCVPAAAMYGLDGFCWALLGANLFRLAFCVVLGYREDKEKLHEA